MGSQKRGLWKKVGIAIGVIGFILACIAFEGLLQLLSKIPIIGLLAKFILYLRETV